MIETPRLILRHWTPEDAARVAHIYADPVSMRYFLDGSPMALDELEKSFERVIAEYALAGYGNNAVVEKASGEIVGHCGLHYEQDSKIGAEADWFIARECWGRGYATEAATAVLTKAFEGLPISAVAGVAHRDNSASLAVMRKLRMSFLSKCERYGFPQVVYRVQREEFLRPLSPEP